MDLPTLLAESSVSDDVRDAALDLIALKAQTRELGTGTPPAVLDRFVTAELERAEDFESMGLEKDPAATRALADEFFRGQVG